MNEMKPEDVMRALELHADCETDNCFECPYEKYLSKADGNCVHHLSMDALALLREKDAEIERLTKERDDARSDCAIAEQLHYECKRELEEMSDDILDSVRAERDRYKAECEQYQSAFLKAHNDAEQERFQCKNICEPTYKNLLETARAVAITEFAERLKSTLIAGGIYPVLVKNSIEKIAKEMKGE